MRLPPQIIVYLVDGPPPFARLPRVRNVRARNRRTAPRLTFRPVGAAGAYPEWLRDLRARAGAYVFRDSASGEIIYVGESAGARLYSTITRHFQSWGRSRKSKKSQLYGSGYYRRETDNDPGTTYSRGATEVAIVLTRPDRAVATQNELIRKLAPRDNIQGQLPIERDDDAIPF